MSDHIVPDELEPGDFWLSTDLDSWGNFHMTELMDMESDIQEIENREARQEEFERLQVLETKTATRLNRSYELAWGLSLDEHEPIKPLLQEIFTILNDIAAEGGDEGVWETIYELGAFLGEETRRSIEDKQDKVENDSDE